MATKRFHDWVGLSGVDRDENLVARRWAKRIEPLLLIVALWILVSWYWDSTSGSHTLNKALDWGIWMFFVFETTTLTYLVTNKSNYLKNNWLNLFIIICGIPVLWTDSPLVAILRSLRLLIFISLMVQLSTTVRYILTRNHLGATLVVSGIFIVVAGYLIAGIDPNISSPADGIWWAWVTATTVGYGDIVPGSTEGRMMGGVLILLGIGLFSIITANISVFFISSTKGKTEKNRLEEIEKKLVRIEHLLEQQNRDKP